MSLSPISAFAANLGNPQRTFLWTIIFPNIVGGGGTAQTIALSAQSASMPERSQGVIKVPFQAAPPLIIPGKLEYPQSWDVTFVESESAQMMATWYAWAQQMVNDVSGVAGGDFADISANALFQLLSADGSTVTSEYTFTSLWVQKIGAVQVDYATSEIVRIPITFAYQGWTITGGNAVTN